MATRRPRPSHAGPWNDAVRTLYRAGGAFLAVGVVAVVLATLGAITSTASTGGAGAVESVLAAVDAAVGSHPRALTGPALVVNLALLAVVSGGWLVGVALVVDGYLEA